MASLGTNPTFVNDGQLVLVCPEGIEGIRKPVTQRYRLQACHVGFVEHGHEGFEVPFAQQVVWHRDEERPRTQVTDEDEQPPAQGPAQVEGGSVTT